MQLENLAKKFPKHINELFEFIISYGFKIGLIGGVTRDFLLFDRVSQDIDCELRCVEGELDQKKWDSFFVELRQRYDGVELLAYEVISFDLQGWNIALNRPRREVFSEENHHKNFKAEFIDDSNYVESFIRRDFTINAIMLEQTAEKLRVVDPLNGLKDIEKKILSPCGSNFGKDPVRFLRALRFKVKLGFTFSQDLTNQFATLDGVKTSSHYFCEEFIKSHNLLSMLLAYAEFDTKLKKITFQKSDLIELKKRLKNFEIIDLCQLVEVVIMDQELTDYLLSLFGLSKRKIVRVKNFDFSSLDLKSAAVTNKEFKEFIDWIDSLYTRLGLEFLRYILVKSGQKKLSEKIEAVENLNNSLDLDKYPAKERKYYWWRDKLDQVL